MIPLKHVFVHYGVQAGAVFPLEFDGQQCMIVGTTKGKCILYSLRSHKLISPLYDDIEGRQIMRIGNWRFGGEKSVWIHFRNSAIEVFELQSHQQQLNTPKLQLVKRISTQHYGFCRALDDWANYRFLIPDCEDGNSIIRVRYENGGEKCLSLSESFLQQSYATRGASVIGNICKGALMSMEVVNSDLILLAFEDSTIAVNNLRTTNLVDCVKHPKYHELLCVATLKPESKTPLLLIGVSVVGQVYLLKCDPTTGRLDTCCVIHKSKGTTNCTSMAFHHRQKNGATLLTCGFNDGRLDGFSIMEQSPNNYTSQQLISLNNFHTTSIQCLEWTNEDELLVVGDLEGKLSIYELSS